jgi:hypothetical protein
MEKLPRGIFLPNEAEKEEFDEWKIKSLLDVNNIIDVIHF